MPHLLSLDGSPPGGLHRLGPVTSLGGGPNDAIPVPGQPEGALEIRSDGQRFVARASAGFLLNEAPATERALCHGDVLQIGKARFQFRNEDTHAYERRSVAHLGALYRVAAVITGSGDLRESLGTALGVMLEETSAARGAAWLVEEEGGRLERAAERARPDATAKAAWEEHYAGLPELQNAAASRSALLVPLVARSRVLGALLLEGSGPGPLGDRDVELVTAVSLIASVAAENRRNAKQMEEYGRLLMSIEKATMWLSSYLERDPILGEAIGFARSIFKASHVSIVEMEAGAKTARVVRQAVRRGEPVEYAVTVGEGWCGRVLASGKPILSPDPATGKPPEGFVKTKRYRTNSFAIVPIFASVSEGADIVGAINVADKIGGAPFNERDVELLAVLARAVGVALQNATLYERATVDSLTRLFVRQHFFYKLEEALTRAQKGRKPLSLLIADLDDFKKVNDTYGHPVGDLVLREVGGAIKRSVRAGDLAARYGGEEFAVIFPGATLAEGRAVAEKILDSIRQAEVDSGGTKVKLTASLGLAELRSGDSAESLIARADAAQYRAKYGGKNRLNMSDK
ncbi:MAG: diguanylate cyclase [Planctomycetes bacterium]|nr:diguanylate cyclase [Planctomycetota bacterium]